MCRMRGWEARRHRLRCGRNTGRGSESFKELALEVHSAGMKCSQRGAVGTHLRSTSRSCVGNHQALIIGLCAGF